MSTNSKYKNTQCSRLVGRAGVEQRKRIRTKDNYTCCTCKRAVRIGEVDHIISLEAGGNNEDSNMQLLCVECHRVKTATDRGYVRRDGADATGMPLGNTHHWNT